MNTILGVWDLASLIPWFCVFVFLVIPNDFWFKIEIIVKKQKDRTVNTITISK